MFHHSTQLLIIALVTTTTSAYLKSQNTKKVRAVDPLARAVSNYEKQLGQLEALLQRQLKLRSKTSTKDVQGSNGKATDNSKAVQLQITTALKAAAITHEQQLRAQHKKFTDLEVRYAKLQEQTKQAKVALSKSLLQSGQAQRASLTANARTQQLEALLATQKSLAGAAARARAPAESRLKTLQAANAQASKQSQPGSMATQRLQTLLASTRKQLRAAETDINNRLTKAEVALAEAKALIDENRKQSRLLTQGQRREDNLKKQLQALRKTISDLQKPPIQTPKHADKTRGIHIDNKGGTIIIRQGNDDSGSRGKQTRTNRAKPPSSTGTGQTKVRAKKQRQAKGAAKLRRINS